MAEQEATLTTVLSRSFLRIPDHWETFAAAYLDALDDATDGDASSAEHSWRSVEARAADRARTLADWHRVLLERLPDAEAITLLERLAVHPALAGPERTLLEAELAHRHGDSARARELIGRCVDALPGHEGFREAARRFAAS